MTNAVITQNQMRSRCPEDYTEVPSTLCCKDHIKRFTNNTLSSEELLEAEPTIDPVGPTIGCWDCWGGIELEPIIEPFEHTIDSKKVYYDLGILGI